MLKKGSLIIISVFFSIGVSFAQDQVLNYEEFLRLYFGITTYEMPIPEETPLLLYTNLKPSNPLYQLLQIAVVHGKFANIKADLPLRRTALESDLALLLKVNYNLEMQVHTGKALTFNTLKTELQNLVLKQKADKNELSKEIPQRIKERVSQQIFSLLKTKFTEKGKLSHLQLPKYEELSDFVDKLWEKYTKYYTPTEWKSFMEILQSEFAGVGMYLMQTGEQPPVIAEVIENTPAEKAGLKTWDSIISINGKEASQYKDLQAFIQDIKGEAWTSVVIGVKRKNQTLHFIIRREKIQIPLIESKKKGTACYLNLYAFDLGAKKRFDEEMKKVWSCASIIFDLRNNPWGVVDEVVGILDEFLPINKPILTIVSQGKKEFLTSQNNPKFSVDKPIAILINGETASASEIFAGVMKYYFPDKVSLIWVKSFGKGSVQEVVEFEEGSLLKYTIALWNIADQEESINHKGLIPDLILQDNPETLEDEVLVKLGLN